MDNFLSKPLWEVFLKNEALATLKACAFMKEFANKAWTTLTTKVKFGPYLISDEICDNAKPLV